MIFSPSPANRTSPSWKPRRSPATSCPGVCRVDAPSATSSRNTRRKQDCRLFIPNNRRWARAKAEKRSTVTRRKEKHEREFLESARVPRAGERVLAIADFLCAFLFAAACEIQSKDCFGATPEPTRETRALPATFAHHTGLNACENRCSTFDLFLRGHFVARGNFSRDRRRLYLVREFLR